MSHPDRGYHANQYGQSASSAPPRPEYTDNSHQQPNHFQQRQYGYNGSDHHSSLPAFGRQHVGQAYNHPQQRPANLGYADAQQRVQSANTSGMGWGATAPEHTTRSRGGGGEQQGVNGLGINAFACTYPHACHNQTGHGCRCTTSKFKDE